MLAKVSVARLSCQIWEASTDQPEKVPAEKCLSAWSQTLPSYSSPVTLSPLMEKQQGVALGAGSGPCGQATIWGRRSRNDIGEGTNKSKSKL